MVEDTVDKNDNPKEGETYSVGELAIPIEKSDAKVKLFGESAKKDGLCFIKAKMPRSVHVAQLFRS
jgi:hypothetical protein